MRLRKSWAPCTAALSVAVAVALSMPGVAQAQLLVNTGGSLGGSWHYTLDFIGPWDFDEVSFVYNNAFDTGAGRFQSPGFDTFVGLGSASWGVSGFNPNVVTASGPSLDEVAVLPETAVGFTVYHDGDGTKRTGYNIGIYEAGGWVTGFQVEVGELDDNTGFVGVFNTSMINQDEYDSHLATIPEPGTFLLVGIGLVAAAAHRRRKKS